MYYTFGEKFMNFNQFDNGCEYTEQQLVCQKVISYLISCFLKMLTSYFTIYYKLRLLHDNFNILLQVGS